MSVQCARTNGKNHNPFSKDCYSCNSDDFSGSSGTLGEGN